MKIAIDLDGVLARFTPDGIRPIVNRLFPGRMPDDYVPTTWSHADILNDTEWNKVWFAIKAVEDFWLDFILEYGDNVLALRRFIANEEHEDVEIFYVTSRTPTAGWTLLEQCHWWLNRLCLVDCRTSIIPIVNDKYSKGMIYAALGIEYSIDDYSKNVESALLAGHRPYLLDRPWNQDATHLPRVKSLEEYLEIVQKALHTSSQHV